MLKGLGLAVRVFEEANLGERSSSEEMYDRPPPRLAAESASLYKVELAEMKRILDSQSVKLPAERFDDTNAELLRFAAAAGLLQVGADTPYSSKHVIVPILLRAARD